MAESQHTTGKASSRPKGVKRSASASHSKKAHKVVEKHTPRTATSKGVKVFVDPHVAAKIAKRGVVVADRVKAVEPIRRGARDAPRDRAPAFLRTAPAPIEHSEAIVRKDQEGRSHMFISFPQGDEDSLQEISDLLGGSQVLGGVIKSEVDAHELLHRGLPRAALSSLVDKIHFITSDEASEALGMSLRTLQRHKNTPAVQLDVQQSGRTWKFAEILTKATRVLGSLDEAEQWLRRPAIGLDQRRPVDLLTTPAGVKLVEDYLERLEYDVYT